MLKSTLNIVLLFIVTITYSNVETYAQPLKAMERIKQMKKMKLLEVLDLSEEEADKFIIKFNSWEKKIDEQRKKADKASEKLENLVKEEADEAEIKKQINLVIDAQKAFFDLKIQNLLDMKNVLSTENYAKYLVFEDRFMKELGRMMMGRGKGQGRGRGRR